MAYRVYDNGVPADTTPYGAGSKMTKGKGWDISRFDTIEEAYEYALNWLGTSYAPTHNLQEALVNRIFDKPWVYSGSGDIIQVKEVR